MTRPAFVVPVVIIIVAIVIFIVITISITSPYPNSKTPNRDQTGRLTSTYVTLPDGRVVSCVYGYDVGGVTCDFDHVKGK